MKNNVTTQQLYELVDQTRKELKADILRLENKFDFLEAGRLNILETDFAKLQGKMAIIAAVISFMIGIFFIVLQNYLNGR